MQSIWKLPLADRRMILAKRSQLNSDLFTINCEISRLNNAINEEKSEYMKTQAKLNLLEKEYNFED